MTELKTLFHKNDPATSKEAAEKMVNSGALSKQEEQILDAVKCYECHTWKENFTAKELASASAIDYHTIQRRLSGLHRKGKIERTGKTRNNCKVWRLTNG